jgi:hypothetical protein
LHELTPQLIAKLIAVINAKLGHKEADSKLYYSESFTQPNRRTGSRIENYLNSRTDKSGMPLSSVICPVDVDPAEVTDEYARAKWVASFETKQYCNYNCELNIY